VIARAASASVGLLWHRGSDRRPAARGRIAHRD
jgi:hypothetical protein